LVGFYLWKNFQPQGNIPPIQDKKEEIKSSQSQEEISRPQISRQEVMESVTKNISNLSPVEPVLGGKWNTINFWFAENFNFYVDYEDGHILRRLLVSIEGKTENPEYKIIGFFEPGDDQWILKEGKNPIFDKPLDLYGWDGIKSEWTKVN